MSFWYSYFGEYEGRTLISDYDIVLKRNVRAQYGQLFRLLHYTYLYCQRVSEDWSYTGSLKGFYSLGAVILGIGLGVCATILALGTLRNSSKLATNQAPILTTLQPKSVLPSISSPSYHSTCFGIKPRFRDFRRPCQVFMVLHPSTIAVLLGASGFH